MEAVKTVVVVGGAGFIGSHVSEALLRAGYQVHVIDNLSTGKREYVPDGATLHVLDALANTELFALLNALSPIHGLFLLAANPKVSLSIEEPFITNQANVDTLVSVLTAASRAGVKKVVYSASSAAYGDQQEMPLKESLVASPKHPYGLQKYIGELHVKLWSELYSLPGVSLRYFNVYGPKCDPYGAYASVIGRFLEQRKHNQPITITGDGSQTRDFVHVRDVAVANILALESTVENGEVINIGSGRNLSIKALAEMVGGPVVYVPARIEAHDSFADITKARTLLGWVPSVSIEEGLADLKQEWGLVA